MKLSILSLLTLATLSPAFAATPKEGDKCTQRQLTGYEKNEDGYCFAEFLSCVGGRLTYIDGVHSPAPASNCGSTNKPKCPYAMEVVLTVNESDPLKTVMAELSELSQQFFDLKFKINEHNPSDTQPPWQVTVRGTPNFEGPIVWDTKFGRSGSRASLKEYLKKNLPHLSSIDVCPGPLETPSVIGTN